MDARLKKSGKQFVKFCFVGASGVIVNLAVFNLTLLVWRLAAGAPPPAAKNQGNRRGLGRSVLTNYYLNRRWTFRSSGDVSSELPKFFTVSIIAYLVNLGVFTIARHGLHLDDNVSQVIAIACVMPINFVLNKLWSFRGA